MSWRLAKSLEKLRKQINTKYPDRDKTSDGSIGDASHRSRKSDHNPWVKDSKGQPIVTAIDIDEDLSDSIHTLKGIIDAICASRDSRVKYIIYEGRITVKGSNLQAWKKYTGVNSHSHHAHISVEPVEHLFDDGRDWALDFVSIQPIPTMPDVQFYYVVNRDTLWGIARKFATDVDTLRHLNGLRSDLLQIGQKLQVK